MSQTATSRKRAWEGGICAIAIALVVLLSATSLYSSESGQAITSNRAANGTNCGRSCQAGEVATASSLLPGLTVTASDPVSYVGASVSFQATVPVGVTATGFTWLWGNGNSTQTTTASASYSYPSSGTYLVDVEAATSGGSVYDNHQALLNHQVLPSANGDELGNLPDLEGSIIANSTTNVNATAAIAPGGFVTVENWVVLEPSNPQWAAGSPDYSVSPSAAPYATLSASITNATGINGVSVSFATDTPNGSYALTFALPLSGPENGVTATVSANYTFTIFIESGDSVPATVLPTSPHPGVIVEYTDIQFSDWDPQLEYDTYDVALLQNVYQTLFFHNVSQDGSSPQDYVPDLATCVPGSALCEELYGSSMETAQGNYTVVINANATFYDPATGAHARVYPNDVAFSLVRDCLSANVGYPTVDFPGWDLCQTLLPGPSSTINPSNDSWDYGIHYPYNNTPTNVLASIIVNDSTYCPASSPMRDGIHGDGCVTFVTSRSGSVWPQFLDDLAMTPGTSIGSCANLTARGEGLPAWSSGDQCIGTPPGTSGNPNPVPNDEAWDTYIKELLGWGFENQSLQFMIPVGSGPYYIASVSPHDANSTDISEIVLKANPYWGGTTCVGGRLAGCLPASDIGSGSATYFATVDIYDNASGNTTPGEAALADGQADLADVSDYAALAADVSQGLARAVPVPTGGVFVLGANLDYNQSSATDLMGGRTSSLPPALLSDLDFRQFLINAFPWSTAEQEACIQQGILLCTQLGGILPAYMAGYDPANLTWPSSNPSSDASVVGTAAWWWAQAELNPNVTAACSASTPCVFPVPLWPGVASWNTSVDLWIQSVESLSSGAIHPVGVVEGPGQNWLAVATSAPGTSPFALQPDEWFPDVFDPSNYIGPYAGAESFYGTPNNLSSLLSGPYGAACTGPSQSPQVTQGCQGTAYHDLLNLIAQGASCAPPECPAATRELLYNEADHLLVALGLLLPLYQSGEVIPIADWIDPASIVNDPYSADLTVLGEPLFDLRYVSVVPPVYPLQVTAPGGFSQILGSSGPATTGIRAEVSTPSVETGETLLILVGVAGGTGVYHYHWNGLPTGCLSADSGAITCEPNGTGAFDLQVNVTDTAGDRGSSPVVAMNVLQGPIISAFHATPAQISLGSLTTFSIEARGGFGELTYAYVGLPAGCSSLNESVVACTPTSAGTYSVVAEIHDSIGVTAISTTSLTVTPAIPPPGPSAPSLTLELEFLGAGAAIGAAVASTIFMLAGLRKDREEASDDQHP